MPLPRQRVPVSQPISNGAHGHALLQAHCKRMVALQGPVLRDSDAEPLHQLRVTMRKLRASLAQFGPCLELPEAVNDRRLARTVQRLGVARDLDVLRDRLDGVLLPQLPQPEQQRLKPVRRQLARERRLAGEQLASVLKSSRHLELIAQLQAWLKQPSYTALGEEPLLQWIAEWTVPASTDLMLHPGWWLELPARTAPACTACANSCAACATGWRTSRPTSPRRGASGSPASSRARACWAS